VVEFNGFKGPLPRRRVFVPCKKKTVSVEVNDTLDRVQKAVEEFFKKTRTTLFEFDKVRVAHSTEQQGLSWSCC